MSELSWGPASALAARDCRAYFWTALRPIEISAAYRLGHAGLAAPIPPLFSCPPCDTPPVCARFTLMMPWADVVRLLGGNVRA